MLLHVEPRACRHLLPDRRELAGHRNDHADLDGLLRRRLTGGQQACTRRPGGDRESASHCSLPLLLVRRRSMSRGSLNAAIVVPRTMEYRAAAGLAARLRARGEEPSSLFCEKRLYPASRTTACS